MEVEGRGGAAIGEVNIYRFGDNIIWKRYCIRQPPFEEDSHNNQPETVGGNGG